MRNSAGDYVIPMRQPYSGYAKALLERQHYPNLLLYPGGPPQRPYDVTAHTLPLLFGVDVKFVDQCRCPARNCKRRTSRDPPARDFYQGLRYRCLASGERMRGPQANPSGAIEAGDFATARAAAPDWHEVKRPRIGLYKSWMADIDEGWTRWLLEQFGFAYTSLRNADIQAGNLRARFDSIVFADEAPERDRERPSARNHAAGVHRRPRRKRRRGAP